MKNFWHIIEKILGIYRWHPELALRYVPIVEKVRRRGFFDILEVGSGGLGIAPYLKQKVVGVDIGFLPPFHSQLIPIKGSAEALPFVDNAFEAVVSTDTLEHIPKEKRDVVITEMMRVARESMYVCMPCGEMAEKEDKALSYEYEQKMGSQFTYFKEHIAFGLPVEEEVIKGIHQAAEKIHKKVTISVHSILNMRIHSWLMRGWMTRNFFLDFFFRKMVLLAIPYLLTQNQEPTYRKLFIIEIIHD